MAESEVAKLKMTKDLRVRFAPSPTGFLHVGGARTALFNWLLARHHGGKFILRIEDTDISRSSTEMVEGILQGLRWLGLEWDEGPFFQSQRIPRYREFARGLLTQRRAYRCFCTPQDLAARTTSQKDSVRRYDRKCLALHPEESEGRAASGDSFVLRFLVPDGSTAYRDLVMEEVEVENDQIEDFVLLRSDGSPTYHLGVVVDDLDMRITHVLRGADHISNTAKQILLYQAAGEAVPAFGHLPLILGPDKSRLSKRHGATSVMAYAEQGYIAEAFFNFLALLGWSPGDDRELFSREELIDLFSLEGVGRANAVFGTDKLEWFNSQYINSCSADVLRSLVLQELKSKNIECQEEARDSLDQTLALLKNRAHRVTDFSGRFRAFFSDQFSYEEKAVKKFLKDPQLERLIPALLREYREASGFTLESTETGLRTLAEQEGVKAGLLINALRVGLTGQSVAPGLFEVMLVLGRKRTLDRMERLANYLNEGREK
jgi:glutamyl-tRNA synthetase